MPSRKLLYTAVLLLTSFPALAQHGSDRGRGQDHNSNRTSQNNYSHRGGQNFYKGVRERGHGGQYYDSRHSRDGYDQRFNQNRGGM
jgi:hypothetical protein